MARPNSILVVAAHPDDEILGCGAAMARLSSEGAHIDILIMAEGLTSRDQERNRATRFAGLSELKQAAQNAATIVGARSTEVLDLPDNRLDGLERLDIIKRVEAKIHEVRPQIIFTHFYNDLNIDHRIVSDAVITACRPFHGQIVQELYFFEVPSSTEWQISANAGTFQPNYFMALSVRHLQAKLDALKAYSGEMREFPHARSYEAVEALAKWRGASVGATAAEAFMTGRRIV